jgi:YVTN family beta-propeller protein
MAVWAAHEEMDLAAGANFAGYRIDGVAGSGRMGVVYRATHPGLGRVVALKLIARELSDSYAFRQRFRAETQRAAGVGLLAQAGAPLIYERGESAGRLFLVMRYVEGSDLGTLVARDGVLEPARAVEIVSQLAGTLDAAHRRGIIHGDLKPGHVLVPDDPGSPACLIDFGVSPPGERLPGEPGPASDVAALGGVLLHALTGRPSGPVPMGEGIPPAFAAVMGRSMRRSPSDRYATASELARAAAAALPDAVDEGAAVEPAEEPRRARRLRRGGRRAQSGDTASGDGDPRQAAAAADALVIEPAGSAQGGFGERPPRSRRGVLAVRVAVAGAVAGGLVAAALAIGGGSGASDGAQRADASGERPAPVERAAATPAQPSAPAARPKPAVVATIPIGRRADGIAFADGAVWVASPGVDELVRIDARTGRVTAKVAAGADPDSVAADGGVAWTSSRGDGHLRRFAGSGRPAAGPATTVGSKPEGIALDAKVAWVVSSVDDTVTRVDRTTGAVVGRPIRVGRQPIDVSTGPSGIWTASSADGTVTHVDAATARAQRAIRVGRQPKGIAEGFGSVWVANNADDTVTRIDPRTGRTTATIGVGDQPSKVVVADGRVWVTSFGDGTVTRIDPRTNRRTGRPIRVGTQPVGIAFGAGNLWVASLGDGTVTKIRP